MKYVWFSLHVEIGEAKPSRILRAVIPESSSSESESEEVEENEAAHSGRFVFVSNNISCYDLLICRSLSPYSLAVL